MIVGSNTARVLDSELKELASKADNPRYVFSSLYAPDKFFSYQGNKLTCLDSQYKELWHINSMNFFRSFGEKKKKILILF